MIPGIKRYPAMKPSGVEWLGEVPEHWELRRVKSISIVKRGASPRPIGDAKYFDDDGNYAWVRIADVTASNRYLEETTQRLSRLGQSLSVALQPGALFLSIAGSVGKPIITNIPCCIHDGFVYFPHFRGNVEFLFYIFSCRAPFEKLGKFGTQLNLNTDTVGNIYLGWPPEIEQTAITRFLGHATEQIERYIRAKEKLIALLEEQKQVMIHDAVTGRIDVRTGKPYPAYKPSGIEYLGEIPEEWRALPLRRLTTHRCDGPFGSGLKSSHYTDEGIRVIRLQNIGHGEFNASDTAYISTDHYATLGDHSVEEGDVLIAGLGDSRHPAGRACVAPASIAPAMVKADCFRFRLKRSEVEPQFLAFQLTATAPLVSGLLSTGATRQRVNFQSASSRMVGIPPLCDQIRITDYVITKSWHINEAQHTAGKEISLLREYRTRLIADVVTGKLDVREAAASLPDLESIADGGDDEIPTESDSQPSNISLHNDSKPTISGFGS